jgi:hypothetical protein
MTPGALERFSGLSGRVLSAGMCPTSPTRLEESLL